MTTHTSSTLRTPRTRGSLAGLVLALLGAWGALAAVGGPLFDYGFGPDVAWTTTTGRWILQILPGAAVFLGGVLLLVATSRVMGIAGGLLASAGGAWFILGPILSTLWDPMGNLQGQPFGTGAWVVAERIGLFAGLGVVILFLAAGATGRFTVRGHRDAQVIEAARQRRTRRERAHTATAAVPGPGPAIADTTTARGVDEAHTRPVVDTERPDTGRRGPSDVA
jgi:hypothetical protein